MPRFLHESKLFLIVVIFYFFSLFFMKKKINKVKLLYFCVTSVSCSSNIIFLSFSFFFPFETIHCVKIPQKHVRLT